MRDYIASFMTIIAGTWVGWVGLKETGFIIPALIVTTIFTVGMSCVWINLREE